MGIEQDPSNNMSVWSGSKWGVDQSCFFVMVKIVITWLEFPNLETSIDSGDFWYPTECRNYRPTAPDKMWMLQLKYYYESLRSIKRAGCKDMV